MPLPARNTLAIIGAGPVGLEAALAALDQGFDVHVFERGEVAAHPIAWGHVRMFTPWRMNVGPSAAAHLGAAGWSRPDADTCPTGAEYARQLLEPIASLPEIKDRIHANAQVVHVSRRGMLKGDGNADQRRAAPFRMLVRDGGGRENYLEAFALIDASGVYGSPNWAGDGGIPARNELYLAPQMSYHVDDVRGLRRERHAGKRTMVIGAGASAATVVSDLAMLAGEAPGTTTAWVTRKSADALYAPISDDPLPERRALHARARALAQGADSSVAHVGGARVENFEFNSATHRYRVALRLDDAPQVEEVDQVIVCAGFGPDNSIYRELQVHECYSTRGPMKLAALLEGATDCLTAPVAGVEALANPEPDFFILGHKSYGRSSHFLLETGFQQVAHVIAALAKERMAAATA